MYGPEPEDVFYYLTLYNETYPMPAIPDGVTEEDVVAGLYRFAAAPDGPSRRATILFSGTAHTAAREAQALLAEHHDVAADLWAAPGWKQLREDAVDVERWNRLHPADDPRTPFLTEKLREAGPAFVAVTDYIRAYPDQVSRWVPGPWISLGTDGFGRSDTREQMRRFFEVDARSVVVAVLTALVEAGEAKTEEVADAIARYEIDPEIPTPRVTP